MDCKHVTNRLSDLALGGLDGPRRAEVEAHVEQCPSCRAALERERRLAAAIDREVAAHLATEPSSDFAARVRLRLAQEAVAPGFSPACRPFAALRAGSEGRRYILDRLVPGLALGGWTRRPAAFALAAALVMGAVWLARRRAPCGAPGCRGGVRTAASGTALTARGTGAVLAEAGVNRSGAEAAVRTPPLQHAVGTRHKTAVRTPPLQREVLPEVIVDRNEQESIVRLYCSLQAGRVDLVSFMAVPPGFKRQADGSLVATPLEIEPADPPSSDADSGAVESSPQPLR